MPNERRRTGSRTRGISKGAGGPGKGTNVISSRSSDRDPGAGTDRTPYLGGAAARSRSQSGGRARGSVSGRRKVSADDDRGRGRGAKNMRRRRAIGKRLGLDKDDKIRKGGMINVRKKDSHRRRSGDYKSEDSGYVNYSRGRTGGNARGRLSDMVGTEGDVRKRKGQRYS